jgi:gliding motility-associated-like protein
MDLKILFTDTKATFKYLIITIIKCNFLFLPFIFFSENIYAQKRNNVWAFGDSIGMNFNTNPVSPFKSKSSGVNPPYYISSICATDGNLLFYTDGISVWNKDNSKLRKYNNWWPWSGNVIPLITPYIADNSLYYIFGIDDEGPHDGNSFRLQYLTTQMYKPGDAGEVVYPRPSDANSFYTTLLTNTSHVLAGTGHCNQIDTWITTHSPGALYSFLITAAGVNPVPVITPVPENILPLTRLNTLYGNIKFAANGERLIIPDNDNNKIVVFDFDNSTGKFSNPEVLSIPDGETLEDIEISADASKLYFGCYEVIAPEVKAEIHYLYQMDLNAGSPAAIEQTLYSLNLGDRTACFHACSIIHRTMQLGPDGRIYVSRRDQMGLKLVESSLAVIKDPSKPGINCHYTELGVELNRKPLFLNYNYIRSASFSPGQNSIQFQKSTCIDQPVEFSLIFSRLDSVKWNFGDTLSGNNNFSTLIKPTHQYPGPGTYKVSTIIYDRCFIDTSSALVTINEEKIVRIPSSLKDTVSCIGGDVLIDATTPFAKQYFWSDGFYTPQRPINKAGTYTLIVTNDCSIDTKTINITLNKCPCDVYIPNAFTPNNDNLNDLFRPIFDCQPDPKDYMLKIYDRYGSVVFESNKLINGWNGKKTQRELPMGIYVWMFQYRNPATGVLILKKGFVTLLR